MRTLVVEQAFVLQVPASTAPESSISIGAPRIRPRLEGYRTALRADAFSATYVDRARVLFTVTPTFTGGLASLQSLGAYLTVDQTPLLGTVSAAAFTPLETDVSGVFTASRGRVSVDLAVNGVVKVSLRLANLSIATAQQFLVQVQVFGDQRAVDVENVAEVENPALPDGLALAQLLDG